MLHTLRRAGYDPTSNRVETEPEFLACLDPAPEIILADFTMPEFDSLRAMEILQERQLDIPFIIVSGTIGEERAVQVMQRGATDYVIKDRLGRLGLAVEQALARWRLKEEKLKAEQTVARLAAIVETSGEAIIATTLDGVITSWNRAAESLYAYQAEEMLGKNVSMLFPHGRRSSDVPEKPQENLARVSRGEHVAVFETVRVRKDGRRIEVLLSISPIRDGKGTVIGASAIALDITLRKRSDRFLSAEQAVTGILTESKTLEEAGPKVLRTVAECLRWEVAALWTIDGSANVLRRMHFWHASWADPVLIEILGQRTVLEQGVGVAGRTWSTGEPVWEQGIQIDSPPTDSAPMTHDGLRGGFGLPMRQGTEMVGVIEFYNPEMREPDAALIAALDSIACQIGQFCERRRTEAALHASEIQFRQLADAMPQIVFTARADGTIDYFNERWYQFADWSPAKNTEQLWASILHAEDLPRAQEAWAHSARTGAPFDVEMRVVDRQTGGYRWFLVRAVAGVDAAGAVARWYGTGTDIDAQRNSLEELKVSEQRFRNLVMALPAAVYTTDRTGLITLFNEHAVEIWGRRPVLGTDRWGGSHKLLQLDGSPLPRDQSPTAKAVLEGRSVRGEELIIERPDGSRSHVFKHPELLRNAAGEIVGAVTMIIDLTEIKQLQEQYRQAQKMEAVGRLAGGVAHDFNNLLTIINGFGELVMGRLEEGDPSREMIRQVVAAGDRAAGLTRQLLAFSRKAIIEPKILDLKAVVAEVDTMLRRLIGEDIEMTVLGDPEVDEVLADAGQIEQVILNLVVNASDAMPKGGQLTIEVRNAELDEHYARERPEVQPGNYVVLSFSDTGCGMDEPTMVRIFEPFFTTKGELGTGLGLATVHGIVKQSGGHISVYSELGIGTTFKIYWPRSEKHQAPSKVERSDRPEPRGCETVLFVEDQEGVRTLCRHVLEEFGYTVLEARDGVEALLVAQQHPDQIDLLATDVVLPKMGGREVAENFAASRPSTKVLYMSGYTDDAVVRHGVLEAQVAFLQKPFSPHALVAKIREVLDGKANR